MLRIVRFTPCIMISTILPVTVNSKSLLKQVVRGCHGDCYDSTELHTSICDSNSSCKRTQFFRCYKEPTCDGLWKETERSQCSVSCNGGALITTLKCFNQTTGENIKKRIYWRATLILLSILVFTV